MGSSAAPGADWNPWQNEKIIDFSAAENRFLASQLEQQVDNMTGVRNCQILVYPARTVDRSGRDDLCYKAGLTALVGITCREGMAYDERMDLHCQVARGLIEYEPRLTEVLVTTSSADQEKIRIWLDEQSRGEDLARYSSSITRLQQQLQNNFYQ